ncbi:MAG: ABC transporter permease [Planctomycetes bacterium]|nr:ABC transporter permease [Planctomycetota bacterium]
MNLLTLYRRELAAYLVSPFGYIIACAFLLFTGRFFHFALVQTQSADVMNEVLGVMDVFSMILVPMITMRLIAEERKSGTLEMLVTAPVTDVEIVASKFGASLTYFILLVAPTGLYVELLRRHGPPDLGAVAAGYLGLVLIASVFLSIGIFVSACSRNQVVAGIVTFVILLLVWMLGLSASQFPEWAVPVVRYVAFFPHFEPFRKGLVDSRDLVYFLSVTGLALFGTVRVLELRRWRG